MSKSSPTIPLAGGLIASIGASICCAGPFVLLLMGVSGSWISGLTVFEPYRPYFTGLVIIMLVWAGWLIHRPIAKCPEGSVCAIPANRHRYQRLFWVITAMAGVLISSTYWIPVFA